MTVLKSGILLILFSVCSHSPLVAQVASLEELYALAVIVEEVPAVLADAGIERIELEERVENYLMDNSIFVSEEEDAYLYVLLRGLEMRNSDGALLGYSYTIDISVRQMAYLLRNMNAIDYVTTWTNTQLGVAPGPAIADAVDQSLVASMDVLISDYYEANTY